MKICVYGAGAVGGVVGGLLSAAAEHEVSLVVFLSAPSALDRPPRAGCGSRRYGRAAGTNSGLQALSPSSAAVLLRITLRTWA